MKKAFVSVIFTLLILSACLSSTLSFSEIEFVPENVEELINPDVTLQLIDEEAKGAYIIFHSNGDIEADLDAQGNIVTLIFNEADPQTKQIKRNVYYLTTDSSHDTINIQVNGEKVALDEVTGM